MLGFHALLGIVAESLTGARRVRRLALLEEIDHSLLNAWLKSHETGELPVDRQCNEHLLEAEARVIPVKRKAGQLITSSICFKGLLADRGEGGSG